MSAIDRMIGRVAPGWAVKRARARAALKAIEAAEVAYDAGRGTRALRDWPRGSRSADSTISQARETVLARARDAVINTYQGAAVRSSYERNIVRSGITPQFVVRRANGDLDAAFNDRAGELFSRWASDPRQVDPERKLSFWRVQRRAVGELVEAGEHFVVMEYRRSSGPIGLQLRCFEPEQLDDSLTRNAQTRNRIRHGIEVDELGAAVAYHFRRRHDDDWHVQGPQTVRIPASRVLHVFDPRRVRQTHGVSRLAPVLNRLSALGRYEEAELMAAILGACIGLIEQPSEDGLGTEIPGLAGPVGDDGLDADGNTEVEFQPGMIVRGNYTGFVPTRPNSVYAEFTRQQDRAIGSGTGASYEQVTRDFSQGSYSSQRQGMLEDWAEYEVLTQVLVETLCQPVVERFVELAVAQGLLPARRWASDPQRYYAVDWQGPSRPWIDPKKEIDAVQTGLALGIDTPQRVLNAKGRTLQRTYAEIDEAARLARRYGFVAPGPPRVGAEPQVRPSVPEPDDEEAAA